MWTRNVPEKKNRIALQLHELPATSKMSLLINDRVVCEKDFRNSNERKLILLNWEEQYDLFEKPYCISIS